MINFFDSFLKIFDWAKLLVLIFVFSSFTQHSSGLTCWQCDDDIDGKDVPDWAGCWGSNTGKSVPCDIPNGFCVSECQVEYAGDDLQSSENRQACSDDTSTIGAPGKCGTNGTETTPGNRLIYNVCSCLSDDCNKELSCHGPTD